MSCRERLEIAQRLRLLEHTEGKLLARDVHIIDVAGRDLDEYSGVRTALVELPGGVQEARAVTSGGCDFLLVADGDANLQQQGVVIVQLFDELSHRKVIAGIDARNMGGDDVLQRRASAAQRITGIRVTKYAQGVVRDDQALLREGAVLRVL